MCARCGQRPQLGKYFLSRGTQDIILCDQCYAEALCRDRQRQQRRDRRRRGVPQEDLYCPHCHTIVGVYIPVAERDAMTFDPAFAYGPRDCRQCHTVVNRCQTVVEHQVLRDPPRPPVEPPIAFDLIRAWVDAHIDARERAEAEWQRTEPERQRRRAKRSEWLALAPAEFEHACATVLRTAGYTSVRVTRATGDGGIDLVAVKDGRQYAGQCKRYQGTVNIGEIRDLAGVLALSTDTYAGGLFLTTGAFSPSTRTLAARANITLIDGPQLIGLAQLPERTEEDTAGDPTDALFALDPAGDGCGT
jgi:hypothetical protein